MTATLDLDCGNSRTKWRCEETRGTSPRGCIPHLERTPDRVRVSSVSISSEILRSEIFRTIGVEPEFAKSAETLAGVTNSYANPDDLGVDRWLAMVAAWNLLERATMIVDAGTAITIDLLDDGGQHLGGYIVPGFALMRKSLAVDTAHVKIRNQSETGADCRLGVNTAQAVHHGTLSMVVAWINQIRGRASDICGADPTVFLIGGDSQILEEFLDFDCLTDHDLVLDGLEIALP